MRKLESFQAADERTSASLRSRRELYRIPNWGGSQGMSVQARDGERCGVGARVHNAEQD